MFSKPLIVIAEHYKVLFWMGVEVILKECCTKYCQLCDTSITLMHCSGKTAESASASLGPPKY